MNSMIHSLALAWAWAGDHPALVWPILTLILTALFKPRTPEQYSAIAKDWPRLAAFMQLVAALGIDAPKVIEALGKIRSGEEKPPKGPSVLPVIFLVVAVSIGASACGPGQTPRETARATVLVVAGAVKQLDGACAKLSYATHDESIAVRCADGYDAARIALLGAEMALDAYDSAAAGDLPCSLAHAVDGMKRMVDAVRGAGGQPPPIVEDAFALAPLITVACRG